MRHYDDIRGVLDRVRRRWRTWRALQAAARAALMVSLVLGLLLVAGRWTDGAPVALATLGLVAFACALTGLLWGLLPLRDVPDDRQVARFIEEREPALDDRLVSAVDVAAHPDSAAGLAEPMLADAAHRIREVSIDAVVPGDTLRRALFQAVAAVAVLAALAIGGRQTVRQAIDAVSLTLFPARVTLEVTPGNARIKAGTPLIIQARLVGNTAPVAAQVQIANGDVWRAADMTAGDSGAFRLVLDSISGSFKYRVAAGAVVSPTYEIAVVRPPRVARIDVDYVYPAGLSLKPRTERDGGDIYAPAGTDVRLHVVTDQPAAAGRIVLSNGQPLDLHLDAQNQLSAALKISDDNSYRVALADREGMSSAGDTEYFIRTLEDRPPDVRILKPASDRSVTRLEEVDVEAQAEDDYGVDRLELVYSLRGENEQAVPLKIARGETTVAGGHTIFLEDLDVKPGDFVSYYVRARDLTRGTRPNEARSDIFFLEVKPYEQEFSLAQSQASASGAGGGRGSIDELVAAQKEIIVATWKLDRRAQLAKNGKSEPDIRSVAQAEAELKTRVEQASSGFRETTMRDPRRRAQPQRGGRGGAPPPEPLKAGETMPEEDEMGAAAAAMTDAVTALEALKTGDARRPEMEALNHLLKAQADVKKREVMRQQAGSGAGSNRSNYDLSSLFDKELQKQQQTNYETRTSAEKKEDAGQSALDKVRELARRQDQLIKQQEELARRRDAMSEEELKRELEKLTREQSELRQRAEDLARQMQSEAAKGQKQNASATQPGQQSSGGQQTQGQKGAQSAQGGQGAGSQQMKDVSDAMRSATNDLRRQDAGQATTSGSRALDKLRELEKQMQAGMPDERRRAMGEMQLEARQIADAQRQVASELGKTPAGDAGKDALRRLAGEEGRLAERARTLQESMKQQGQSADAGKDVERQKLADRMQQSAEALRAAAERGPGAQRGSTAPAPPSDEARGQVAPQQEMARALDKVADKLRAAAGGAKDAESGKLSGQLARTQELRDRLDRIGDEMKRLAQGGQGRSGGQDASGRRGAGQGEAQSSSPSKSPGQSGRSGEGQGGGGGAGSDAARLRDEAQRTLQEMRELMEEVRRDDPSVSRGGAGFTFEGQGMTTSSPGTESFKQDFAKWDDLRRQAASALENVQSAIAKKLQAKESKERLAAGADDKAPPEYQKQVDDYFKAIAAKKKGS
jgi:hypothetical protein